MEMEATGAPQNHYHTLNQQVGSITQMRFAMPQMMKNWQASAFIGDFLTRVIFQRYLSNALG